MSQANSIGYGTNNLFTSSINNSPKQQNCSHVAKNQNISFSGNLARKLPSQPAISLKTIWQALLRFSPANLTEAKLKSARTFKPPNIDSCPPKPKYINCADMGKFVKIERGDDETTVVSAELYQLAQKILAEKSPTSVKKSKPNYKPDVKIVGPRLRFDTPNNNKAEYIPVNETEEISTRRSSELIDLKC